MPPDGPAKATRAAPRVAANAPPARSNAAATPNTKNGRRISLSHFCYQKWKQAAGRARGRAAAAAGGGGGGGGGGVYSYSMDTIEGPRAPAVKLTARHSSLTRVRAAPLSPW